MLSARRPWAKRCAKIWALLLRLCSLKVGLFVWAHFTGAGGKLKDDADFTKRAIYNGIAFVPGVPFYVSNPDTFTLRLNFATADVAKIEEGVGRLAQALQAFTMAALALCLVFRA